MHGAIHAVVQALVAAAGLLAPPPPQVQYGSHWGAGCGLSLGAISHSPLAAGRPRPVPTAAAAVCCVPSPDPHARALGTRLASHPAAGAGPSPAAPGRCRPVAPSPS